MIVEIPKNSANKYEYDGEVGCVPPGPRAVLADALSGRLRLHPGTLAEDGDPMDVLALVEEPSFPDA